MANESQSSQAPLILVTGITGFIAAHCAKLALEAGARVRGTVRSLTSSKADFLKELAGSEKLELVEADLLAGEEVWDKAVSGGVRHVLHVASPFPASQPKDENDLIKPAVQGTLGVLKAVARHNAKASSEQDKIKKVVVTSSVAAIANGWGQEGEGKEWTDDDWSKVGYFSSLRHFDWVRGVSDPSWLTTQTDNPLDPLPAYPKSKTLAEKAAWDFHSSLTPEESFQLVVVNPGFVLGPMLSTSQCTSAELVQRMMHRTMPAVPDLYFSAVDVRDIALAHLKALIDPSAPGNRYQSISFTFALRDCCAMLAAKFGKLGYSVPTGNLPGFLLKVIGLWDATVREVSKNVGKKNKHACGKFEKLLGRPTVPWQKSVEDMTWTMIANGLVNAPSTPEGLEEAKKKAKEILTTKDVGLEGVELL